METMEDKATFLSLDAWRAYSLNDIDIFFEVLLCVLVSELSGTSILILGLECQKKKELVIKQTMDSVSCCSFNCA